MFSPLYTSNCESCDVLNAFAAPVGICLIRLRMNRSSDQSFFTVWISSFLLSFFPSFPNVHTRSHTPKHARTPCIFNIHIERKLLSIRGDFLLGFRDRRRALKKHLKDSRRQSTFPFPIMPIFSLIFWTDLTTFPRSKTGLRKREPVKGLTEGWVAWWGALPRTMLMETLAVTVLLFKCECSASQIDFRFEYQPSKDNSCILNEKKKGLRCIHHFSFVRLYKLLQFYSANKYWYGIMKL